MLLSRLALYAGRQCTAIPSLAEGQQFDLATVSVPRYPACEAQGNVWVYFGDDPSRAPEVPRVEGFAESEAPRSSRRCGLARRSMIALSGSWTRRTPLCAPRLVVAITPFGA